MENSMNIKEESYNNLPRLENWALGRFPFQLKWALPKNSRIRLLGNIYNDVTRGQFLDGSHIRTSEVKRKDIDLTNNRVITASGMIYTLGYIDPKFLQFLDKNNHALSEFKLG